MLGQHREVSRHVGGGEAALQRQIAHVAFAISQQVENSQTRGLGQRLKIGGHL